MTTLTVNTPAQVQEPRGSLWLGQILTAVMSQLRRSNAQRNQTNQARAAAKARLKDVAHARSLAREMSRHDPRVAADLWAAIDRYEAQV